MSVKFLRRVMLACLLCVLAIGTAPQTPEGTTPTSSERGDKSEGQAGQQNASSKPQQTGPGALIEAPASSAGENTAEEERREKKQKILLDERLTVATEKLADYTLALFIATGVLSVLTIGLLLYARRQARDARDAGRAWIGAPTIGAVEQPDGTYRFRFEIRNVGQRPAQGLYIRGVHVKRDAYEDASDCFSFGISAIKAGQVLFNKLNIVPTGDFALTSAPNNPHFDIDFDASTWIDRQKRGEILYDGDPLIAGCVIYGPPIKGKLRKTLFWAQLQIEGGRVGVRHVWTSEAT